MTRVPLAAATALTSAPSLSVGSRTFPGAPVPTVKENRLEDDPTTRTADVTVTSSPGQNGLAGRYVAPEPTLLRISLPGWSPLRLPTTRTAPSEAGPRPRNVIEVDGEAVRHPGPG